MEIMNCISTSRKYIPIDIVHDILLRLPVKSLLRFRCVSKMCCKTIDNVSFAIMHGSAYVEESQILYTPFDLMSMKKLYSHEYEEANNVIKISEIPVLEFSGEHMYLLYFVAYGLLCIRDVQAHQQHEIVFLLNPLRGEVLELPGPTSKLRNITPKCMLWYGMGFDCTTNTYKIVRVIRTFGAEFQSEIHTLGTDSWRQIDSNPYFMLSNCGVNAYGDMHWIRSNLEGYIKHKRLITSFDFKNEEFKWTRPPNFEYDAHAPCKKFKLINLKGSLTIVSVPSYNQMEIWVMKDYDKKEYYWVREFRVSDDNINLYGIASWRHIWGITQYFGAWPKGGSYLDIYPNKQYVIDLNKNHMGYINKWIRILREDYTDDETDVYSYTRSVVCLRNFGNPIANHSYNFLKIAYHIFVSPQ